MAKRKFRPQSGQHQPAPQQVKLDLGNAETMKCEYCGNYIFMKGTVIKRISALMSPPNQPTLPICPSSSSWTTLNPFELTQA